MSVQIEDACGVSEALAHMLLVHDGTAGNSRLEAELINAGFFVTTAESQEEVLQLLLKLQPDLLVMGTDVVGTFGWKLSRLNRAQVANESESHPPIDFDQVQACVESLVRTSLLPPPLESALLRA